MNYILSRLKEPSTYAGLAAFIGGLSFLPHYNEVAQIIVPLGAVVAGILAIVLPETKTPVGQ